MLNKFKKHLDENFPFLKTESFFVAVSGGIDSMVLVHLLQHFQYSFGLLHCNFKLRGDESDGDFRFIDNYCKTNKLKLRSVSFDTTKIANFTKTSIQETARNLRYGWFKEQMQEKNINYVLTAHHLDDSLETFLINLSRGTGIDGLLGIPERNNHILRPLLPFSREEIEDYAKAKNLKWREDSSNESDKYLRNKIRHHVVPQLKDISPDFLRSFHKTISHLKEASILAEDAAYIVLQEVSNEVDNVRYFDISKIKTMTDIKPYLYYWFKEFGFRAWNDVYKLLDAETGKKVLSESHVLTKDHKYLVLNEIDLQKSKQNCFSIDKNCDQRGFPLKFDFFAVSKIENKNVHTIFVDADLLAFPLRLRPAETADVFYPFGMKGKKTLTKFMKDEKLSIFEKSNLWLLCSNDDIVWIVGHRQDNRFRVTDETKNILKIVFSS